MDLGSSNPNPSPGERGMGEMELDAARALADFKQMAMFERRERDLDESRSEPADLVGDDPQDSKAAEAVMKEIIKIEPDPELSVSSISCISSHVSCLGRRMKQNMTEAEREAKRILRVLANRESARQTIRRRQVLREELIKRVADLSRENKDTKMKKELVMKEYLSLKDRNRELKEQMVKAMESEAKVRAEISTELSLVAPSVASYEEGGPSKPCASRNPFFAPPCVWFYPLFPQTSGFFPSTVNNPHEDMNTGINLEEMPIEFDQVGSMEEEKSQLPVMKLVDPGAAAAARKRRKELTKLRHLHGKQIRLHG